MTAMKYDATLFTDPLGSESDPDPTVESHGTSGETLDALERIIVAPATGTFQPLPPKTVTTEGEIVHCGQVIGTVSSRGSEVPVESRFTGFFMGLLAVPTERVHEGQPIAWLRRTAP
jgi:biotin carboxyl carrier protein